MVQNKVKDTRRPGMPGWKGLGRTPKAVPRPSNTSKQSSAPTSRPSLLYLEQQQLLLNIFRNTYAPLFISDGLAATLQEIKTALFERDFARAFGTQKYLEAYAARWSPSRALCYASVLIELREHLAEFDMFALRGKKQKAGSREGKDKEKERSDLLPTRIVSLGGGAAEVVAFGGALKYLLSSPLKNSSVATPPPTVEEESLPVPATDQEAELPLLCDLHLLDTAAWGPSAATLTTSLTAPPPLSPHASARARAAATPLLPTTTIRTTFHQHDVLALTPTTLAEIVCPEPCIVTLFFTLNELFTASTARTTALLLSLSSMAPGSMILVIDSPGSYSEAAIGVEGGEKRKYPMAWLLDHALVPQKLGKDDGSQGSPQWEKVLGDEARWFRLGEGLKYPIQLEDMRFQLHVFRRL
jgi:25S rRNA (uracil2843-N3)-methyltransferase